MQNLELRFYLVKISAKRNPALALQYFQILLLQATEGMIDTLSDVIADIVGEHLVGNRSGRKEPRAKKRRPKPNLGYNTQENKRVGLRCTRSNS